MVIELSTVLLLPGLPYKEERYAAKGGTILTGEILNVFIFLKDPRFILQNSERYVFAAHCKYWNNNTLNFLT